jgi:MFS family permease
VQTDRVYYLLFGLYTLSGWFVAPVYALFLMSRGLDLFQIDVVLAVYLLTVFAFEVPTGAIADAFGRKTSFLASCAVRTVAFVLYAFADDFGDCLIAEVIDGVGTTLASGSLEAWAVDRMRSEGREGSLDAFFARAQTLTRVAMIGGGILCGVIAARSYALAWTVGASGFVLAGVLGALLMREDRPRGEVSALLRSPLPLAREGFAALRGSPVLALLCALTAATYFAALPAHMLWQPRTQELTGGGPRLMGWVWALLNVATLIGSEVLPRLLGRFARERVLAAAVLWRAALLSIAALATRAPLVIGGFLVQEVSVGMTEPVLQSWTNDHVPAERRATLLSVRSMFGTLGGGIGLLVIGLVARDHGARIAWLVSAAIFALAAPGFLALGRLEAKQGPAAPVIPAGAVPAKVVPPG